MATLTLRRPDPSEKPAQGPVIRRLDPLVVNQIAAGEVIERPASVVKELVENALDAGATSVTLELDGGGVARVSVIDDGVGVPPDQLQLALTPHATSKIIETADLDRVATLGFRGEALASIASVARVTMLSRTASADEAWSVHAEGGGPGEPAPAAAPRGTRVDVRDLFFNTPARRKFLRTPGTERTRCLDWLRHLALAHPAVGFTVRCDGREAIALPRGQTPRERTIAVLGRELAGQLLEVHVDRYDDARGLVIFGFAGLPGIARPTAAGQHVFLNGRVIRDKTVQHALREAYRGLIEPGRHPTAVLMLEMAPTAVDVNVHPAKLEVRFRDQSMVHAAVLTGVRRALEAADLTRAATSWGAPPRSAAVFGPGRVGTDPGAFVAEVRALRDEAERRYRGVPDVAAIRAALAAGDGPLSGAGSVASPAAGHGPGANATAKPARRFMQVHDSYIVVEDEAGLLLIDQHALHERVMFQTLLQRLGLAEDAAHDGAGDGVGRATLESQRLLVAVPVACDASAVDRIEALSDVLERLGIELVALGPRTVGVRAFPSLLSARGVDAGGFVAELLERSALEGFAPSGEAALHEVLDMMACKAAVKAGQRLSDEEISTLLEQREKVERSSNCPHGRPTSIRLGLAQIERLFERR